MTELLPTEANMEALEIAETDSATEIPMSIKGTFPYIMGLGSPDAGDWYDF